MRVVWSLAAAANTLRTGWQYRGHRPFVLVHQMARVGSKSIRQALRLHAPDVHSFHTHYLDPRTIAEHRALFQRLYRSSGHPGMYREHHQAEFLARRLRNGTARDWKVITLVRDPIARTVSAFFRHFPLHHPELGEAFRDDPTNAPALVELFEDPDHPEHAFALKWFEREVQDVFGVDVYGTPFSLGARHALHVCAAGEVLVLRTEDLREHGGSVLSRFLDRPTLTLPHVNKSSELRYAETFLRFSRLFRPSPDYLKRMYDSRLTRHFYSDEEIEGFRRRWTSGNERGQEQARG